MKRIPLFALPALMLVAPSFGQEGQAAPEPQSGGVIELPALEKLKITGQYRLRYELRNLFLFDMTDPANPVPMDTETYDFFGQRVRLNFDLELNDQISSLIQLQDVRFWGEEEGGTVTRESPGLDLHQAYVQVKDFPWIGGTDRLGRQILSYGNQRLVGGLEWLNQGRAFDGLRHWWTGEGFQADVFVTQISENLQMTPAGFDQDSYFIGSYNTFDLYEGGLIDAYLLYANIGEQNTDRWTIGARWDHKGDTFDAEVEYATQTGEIGDVDIPIIDTYAFAAALSWKIGGDMKWYGKLGLDAASGNDGTDAGENARFANLFPTAHKHWGMMDFALWENLMAPSLEIGLKPCELSKLALTFWMFQSQEEGDSFGGPGGLLVPAGTTTSDDIGTEIDLFYHRNVPIDGKATLGVQAGLAAFMPGDAVEEARQGNDDMHYFFYLQGDFRF